MNEDNAWHTTACAMGSPSAQTYYKKKLCSTPLLTLQFKKNEPFKYCLEKKEGRRVKNSWQKEDDSIWFVLVLEFKLIEGLEM